MKRKRITSILLIAALVAFLALCVGFIFGGSTYTAYAEEPGAEVPQDEEEGADSDEVSSVVGSEGADEPESDETSEVGEIPDGEINFDLDAFLAFVQKYADEAGVGDEYAKAVEAIKTAATQKQVTLSTIVNGGLLLVMLVYVVAKSIKKKKETAALAKASAQLTNQTSAMNQMIDELNANEKTAQETEKRLLKLEAGFRDFIKGFMTFVDRTRVDKESKEAIKHELNAAIRDTDGEPETTERTETEAGADENKA